MARSISARMACDRVQLSPGWHSPRRRHAVSKFPKTAFQKGCAPGPGRPPGARNRLTEVALQALGNDFAEHGAAAIAKVRAEKPHVYLQVVASLLPRQVQMEKLSPLGDISDEELHQIEELLAASRAKLVQKLNGTAVAFEPSDANQQQEK
jgi:hypothetical protein